ncbi:MAG: hypothetical protein ACFFCQ_05900 [Promethearchaeota archaeon]
MKFYLTGPIWESSDTSVTWREDLAKKLLSLGHEVIDPTKKEGDVKPAKLQEMRRKFGRKSDQVRKIVNFVFEKDLELIRESDALVAYLPKSIHSIGSIQEIFYCKEVLKRPVFVITDRNYIEDVPLFLDRTSSEIFDTFEKFLSYLTSYSH